MTALDLDTILERATDPIDHVDLEAVLSEHVPALVAAIRAAAALHPKTTVTTFTPIDPDQTPSTRDICGLCRDPWPCSTITALSTGELH